MGSLVERERLQNFVNNGEKGGTYLLRYRNAAPPQRYSRPYGQQ